MTWLLVALLARVLPSRGRHTGLAAPQDPPAPPDPVWDDAWYSPGEMTRLDIPPFRVRPYVGRANTPQDTDTDTE